jgi:hypothetical protein
MVTFVNRRAVPQEPLLPGFDDMPVIKPKTLLKGRRIVERSGSGWDFNALREQFTLSLMEGFRPGRIDGAFINFIKKKVRERP